MPEQPDRQNAQRAARKSRQEMMKEKGIEPHMPPLDWGDYLIGYLFELGPTMPAGMGNGPLSPSEIEAAQRLLGVEFQPWEARLLMRLSREYLAESHKATEQNSPAPWQDAEAVQVDRAELARQLEQSVVGLAED